MKPHFILKIMVIASIQHTTPDSTINYDNADNYNNGVCMKIKAVHFPAPDIVLNIRSPPAANATGVFLVKKQNQEQENEQL